jgi:hypothetical protein
MMFDNTFYEVLTRELDLQIKTKKSMGNIKTALKAVYKIDGVEGCHKLLTTDGTVELCETLISSWESQGIAAKNIHGRKSNLLKLASLARNLPKAQRPDEDQAADWSPDMSVISIENAERKPLGELIRSALNIYYQGHPVCCQADTVSFTKASTDIHIRSGKVLGEQFARNRVSKKHKPPFNMIKKFSLLEKLLNVREGLFTERCYQSVTKSQAKNQKRVDKGIEQGDRKKSFQLPEHVQVQWDAMATFYNTGKVPATIPASFEDDHVSSKRVCDGKSWPLKYVPEKKKKVSTTTDINLRQAQGFFSWLHKEHGVPLEDLDLSLLAQYKLLEQYKEFKLEQGEAERKEGRGVATSIKIIALVAKIYKEQHSYGSRYHAPTVGITFRHNSKMISAQYPTGLDIYESSEAWGKERDILHGNITETKKELTKALNKKANKSTTEDDKGGKSNILGFLKLKDTENPMTDSVEKYIKPMIEILADWAEDEFKSLTQRARLSAGRSAAFYALELERPLRILNAACIEILPEPCCETAALSWESMWVTEEGDYRIHIPKERLKNEESKHSGDVEIKLIKGEFSHAIMKRWLKVRSDILKAEKIESKWLFTQVDVGLIGKPIWQLTASGGSLRVGGGESFKDQSYAAFIDLLGAKKARELRILEGINPHAMRHIVAHWRVETSNDDYTFVAFLLMDSVDMVIDVYGRDEDHTRQKKKQEKMKNAELAALKSKKK